MTAIAWDLHQGKLEDVLPLMMDAESVDSIVCDPPYDLTSIVKRFGKEGSAPAQEGSDGRFSRLSKGFMGQTWDGTGVAFRVETWAHLLRVAKPGAHLLAFGGTRTHHRMMVAIEDAGWEIRDTMLYWGYATGFPKSHNLDGEMEGWGTALKPAYEPIIMARKPLSGTVAANAAAHGVGALNIDGCRVRAGHLTGQRPEDMMETWEREQRLCASCVGSVGESAKPATPDTRDSSARRLVVPISSGRARLPLDGDDKTGTGFLSGLSPEEQSAAPSAGTSSSMSKSGKTRTDPSPPATSSTTRTKTDSITALRTCASCGEAIMSDSITNSAAIPNRGRWPSNLILGCPCEGGDHLPECPVRMLDEQSGQRTSGTGAVKKATAAGWEGQSLGRESRPYGTPNVEYGDTGGASRFYYVAKSSRAEREAGLAGLEARKSSKLGDGLQSCVGHPNPRAVGTTSSEDRRSTNHHPTVKPIALMRYLVRLVTPPGGLVLDPFAGSGTTGIAAIQEGMRFVGIEMTPDYAKIAVRRLAHAARQGRLPL